MHLTDDPKLDLVLEREVGHAPGETTRKSHEGMGFHEGWGKAFDQLVAHMKSI